MKDHMNRPTQSNGITLVLGGTGKTGRRIVERLVNRGVPTRVASRSADPSFDWNDQSTWDAALDGVTAVYVSYAPDRIANSGVWNVSSSLHTALGQ